MGRKDKNGFLKKEIIVFFSVFSLLFLFSVLEVNARKSDHLKPQWISRTPQPTNSTYVFKVVFTDSAEELEGARMASLKELTKNVERDEQVKVSETYNYQSEQNSRNGKDLSNQDSEIYAMKIESEGKILELNYLKIDEYWEQVYENGRVSFKLYTLYAVARKEVRPYFDDVSLTKYYGMQGFARSLVPGWGQMYKGSMTKGLCILGGEVVCIAGIIVSESLRSSYVKKMKEQPKFAKDYNSKADNWENGRNICIGAAAALYVYNLIDAIAAKGAKRVVVKQAGKPSFSLSPAIIDDGCGLKFAYRF